MAEKITDYKAGFVAILGEPNSGKSTLINLLVGEKVAIVSAKPQTTRQRVVGLLTEDKYQMVIVDTPGLVDATRGRLHEFLAFEIEDAVKNSDVYLVAVAAQPKRFDRIAATVSALRNAKKPFFVLLTKSDLVSSAERENLARELSAATGVEQNQILIVSASKNPDETRSKVLEQVQSVLPAAEAALYDQDMYTTQTLREMAGEVIREKCFDHLEQEVPFGVAVLVRSFKENPACVDIEADILVDKFNHKGIVIGSGGRMLKVIGTEARLDLEKVLDQKVFLKLHVVVKENWVKSSNWMRELGYSADRQRASER